MNIGRHNYEEFFLLYADNELNAAERKAVQAFVAQNPDLEAELRMLLQTILPADELSFENKSALLKEEISPLQQQLLLYIDNELPAAEKLQAEQLIGANAAAAAEAAILQRTKMQPDMAVVYANKKELYRKEEGRLIRMNWRMAAAAAIVLGIGLWGALNLMEPAQKTNDAASMANGNKPAVTTTGNNNTVTADASVRSASNAAPAVNNTATANAAMNTVSNTNTTTQKNNRPAENNSIKQQAVPVVNSNDNNTVAKKDDEKPSNNLPTPTNNPRYNNFNNDNRNITLAQNVTPAEDAVKKANSGNPDLAVSSTKPNTSAVNGYAITAAFKPDETEEVSNNKVLYMDEDNVKRTKLAGFIRKVKRVVERNTNIKTGNGIQVAGFDIALNR